MPDASSYCNGYDKKVCVSCWRSYAALSVYLWLCFLWFYTLCIIRSQFYMIRLNISLDGYLRLYMNPHFKVLQYFLNKCMQMVPVTNTVQNDIPTTTLYVACLVIFRDPSKPWLRSSPQKNNLTLAHPDFSSSLLGATSEVLLKWVALIAELGALWLERERNSHSIASGRPVS